MCEKKFLFKIHENLRFDFKSSNKTFQLQEVNDYNKSFRLLFKFIKQLQYFQPLLIEMTTVY